MSASRDGTARLWDIADGLSCIRVFGETPQQDRDHRPVGHTGHVNVGKLGSFSFGSNIVVTGGDDGLVKVWDSRMQNGGLALNLSGHEGPIRTIQAGSFVAPTICSGSDDGTVRIWDVRRASSGAEGNDACRVVCNGHNPPTAGPPPVPPRPNVGLNLSQEGKLASAPNNRAGVCSLQWHWGRVVSTGYSRKVLVHDAVSGKLSFQWNRAHGAMSKSVYGCVARNINKFGF